MERLQRDGCSSPPLLSLPLPPQVISVEPLVEGSEADRKVAEAAMVARRAAVKRAMVPGKALEPALFFPLPHKGSMSHRRALPHTL